MLQQPRPEDAERILREHPHLSTVLHKVEVTSTGHDRTEPRDLLGLAMAKLGLVHLFTKTDTFTVEYSSDQQQTTWKCRCGKDSVVYVPAVSGTRAHYACTECHTAYDRPPVI